MAMIKTYKVRANIIICKLCGKKKDCRCGTCFDCSQFVAGELVTPGVHRLWDSRNPVNSWYYREVD